MQSTKCRNSATHQSAPDSARDELELFPAAAEAKEAGAIVVVLREKVCCGADWGCRGHEFEMLSAGTRFVLRARLVGLVLSLQAL